MPSRYIRFSAGFAVLAVTGTLLVLAQTPATTPAPAPAPGQAAPAQVPSSAVAPAAQAPAGQAPAAAGGIEQQPGGAGFHLSVTAKVVVLDVVVTDKHGVLVKKDDLTKDDFAIYENKAPQRILSFEPPSKHAMPKSDVPVVNSVADLKKIGDAPVTILVLDELNSRFEDMSFSRQMMMKYLQEQPAVLHEPTELLIASNTKFTMAHDWTQSRDELMDVVKKHMPEYPWRMMNSGKQGPGAVERMAQGLASFQQLAQSTSGTPGRKNVVWVGNGFPNADLVGLDLAQTTAIEAAIRRVTAKMLASRITLYTINPVAGTSSTLDIETPDDLDSAQNDGGVDPFSGGTVGFNTFAPATGGMAFQGRNDINNVIAEGIAQGEQYYTLSYSPTDKTLDPTKYRDIEIVMKDPNLRATTRKGYFPDTGSDTNELEDATATAKQKQADLALDLSQALTSTLPYNGLNVTADKGKPGEYNVQVGFENLTWSEPGNDGAEHSEATVAAGWYDAKNKVIGHVAREETFPRGQGNSGAAFSLPLPVMPSNVVRLRFVVRDALSGKMGTFDIQLKDVPVKK